MQREAALGDGGPLEEGDLELQPCHLLRVRVGDGRMFRIRVRVEGGVGVGVRSRVRC